MSPASAARHAAAAVPPIDRILDPGRNCWRVERADRFRCVQDAADYFRFVRQALLSARRTVFILGWDIAAHIDLLPGGADDGAPTRLDRVLAFIVRRRPGLRCYILIWDYGVLHTLERDPLSRWRLGWRMPRGVRFGFDDRHPVGGCHHQKVVVVDDRLAFCGGIDLTTHRWDTSAHRAEEPFRTTAVGSPYGPYHEIQAMVSGPAAACLGALARDRWQAMGETRLPPVNPIDDDPWPASVQADLVGADVGIARTVPASDSQPAIRECEALFVDAIAAARHTIYIESQYFTSEPLSKALAARLRERDGPEIVVVAPLVCHGWLERNTMGALRDRIFAGLRAADVHQRLRLVYPLASRAHDVATFVHSKVMIVDDAFARIGSANVSERSLGMDTECDLAVDARGDRSIERGIRRIRDNLLAEHLGLSTAAVAGALGETGSIRALIDRHVHDEHTLAPITAAAETVDLPEVLREAADPYEPIATSPAPANLTPAAEATSRRLDLLLVAVGLVVVAALAGGGGLLRRTLQQPTTGNVLITIGAGLVLLAGAGVFRTLLLLRRVAPSISHQRHRAEFG